MAFGLYQRWFRRPNKDFCEKSFFERYGSIVLQQQWEDTIKVSVFYVFFFQKTFTRHNNLFRHFKNMKYTINII